MDFWYKLITYLFYPFSNLYLNYRIIKNKEDPKRYKEKLSKISAPRGEGFLVWFHVASVGEAMSILPLIEKCSNNKKINKILITSITLSSAKILTKKFDQNQNIIHQYLPLDIPKFNNTFLQHWKPNLSIFIDSEIWPNLVTEIKERNIPLILLNARITEKTFNKWKKLKNFSKKIFNKFDLCISSNKESEFFLKDLGAKNIKNFGNLKFTNSKNINQNKLKPDFLLRLANRKVWCAASTHSGEEIFCANIHQILKKKYDNILTIIIPRHIQRIEKIKKDLANMKLNVTLYSNSDNINLNTDILLVDTYGDALKFYNRAKCVFLGKSIVKTLSKDSGQNPIEAARQSCKVFHGPNVSNFKEIYEYLKNLDITKEVNNMEDLSSLLFEELKKDKVKNIEIEKKLENYGEKILENVHQELEKYIK